MSKRLVLGFIGAAIVAGIIGFGITRSWSQDGPIHIHSLQYVPVTLQDAVRPGNPNPSFPSGSPGFDLTIAPPWPADETADLSFDVTVEPLQTPPPPLGSPPIPTPMPGAITFPPKPTLVRPNQTGTVHLEIADNRTTQYFVVQVVETGGKAIAERKYRGGTMVTILPARH